MVQMQVEAIYYDLPFSLSGVTDCIFAHVLFQYFAREYFHNRTCMDFMVDRYGSFCYPLATSMDGAHNDFFIRRQSAKTVS